MRIGMILDAPFPPDYRVEKEALTLIDSGFEVVLFCLEYEKESYEEDYKGIHIVHCQTNKMLYRLSALVYTVPIYHFFMKRKLSTFQKKFKPDLIHVHDMVIAEAALSVAAENKVRVVLDLHENRPASMREYRHTNVFPGNLLINLSTWEKKQTELANRADRVIVVTSLAKEILIRETGKATDHVTVVPNTSTLAFSEEPVSQEIVNRMRGTFNLLYVGDTSIRRGTDDSIKAIAQLREEIPEIRLWIIGKSSADSFLRQLADELGVSDIVFFEGWQDQRLFTSYMSGSHICLSPLSSNPHHNTTFANKLFQYMAMARPVVVSDCIAQARVVNEENCGLVYPAGNVAEMCSCIITLYKDDSLRQSLGNNGRRAVEERWNWDKTSQPLVDMYLQLVHTTPP